jgi:ribosome biogenesis protein ERB1
MASKRKAKDESKTPDVKSIESEEDEAIGKDLDLDKSGSDDSDSSVYSDLEEEDEDDSEDESVDEEESDASSDSGDEEENVDKVVKAKIKAKKPKEGKTKEDEYNYDSSDEEDIRNTIGNIPVNWYDEYDHIGYDLDGSKIRKPKRGDELENFLSRMENPEHGVTVEDPATGQKVVLSEADAEIVSRAAGNKVPDPGYDLYGKWSEWFSSDVMETPLRDTQESKKSFLPSHCEKQKVGKMVHAIKMGWMKPRPATQTKTEDAASKYYMLWQTDDQVESTMRRVHDPIPAPKMYLPGNEESYNPPPEYLFTDNEKMSWERATREGDKRKLPFIPQKYSSLRKVPAWSTFIRERFERCLDLYLAPRQRKMRLTITPEDLVPQLPRPQDLQPFPTVCSITMKGHNNMVRSLDVEPKGQYLASGSDDGSMKVWEMSTGRCLKTWDMGGVVKSVAWCPNSALSLLAVAVETVVYLINTGLGDKLVNTRTDELLSEEPDNSGYVPPARVSQAVKWSGPEESNPPGTLVTVTHFKPVKQVTWHAKGDYFASVLPEGANRSVLIHQLSKWRSQVPFSKAKGQVQCVLFHPIRPSLFVATQRHVRIYDLVKQELTKKLMSGAKWISSIAIHPNGDNILTGTFDKKVQWYDLDLSSMPYQVLRYHTNAVRAVQYHKRYPLFASCGDDNNITVSHGMVYNDLLQNPLIVPVKRLYGHTKYEDFGVMTIMWHPTQPWLISAGADGHIKLWT